MNTAPPLNEKEEVIFDHIPSLRAFKRTALFILALQIPVVAVFIYAFPDTFWPAVPVFVACVILMQERVRLGRYRAWITNERIILQDDLSVALADVRGAAHQGNGVRVQVEGHAGKWIKLYYPDDGAKLAEVINRQKGTINV